MQKQIAEGMHTFSHVMTHTDFSHHEADHELGRKHTHEHKMITFFSKIFSSEKNNEQEGAFFNYTLDKHFGQAYPKIDFRFLANTKHIFNYVYHIPKNAKTIFTPPPEVFFS